MKRKLCEQLNVKSRIEAVKELGQHILNDMEIEKLQNFHKHVKKVEANFVRIHNLQLERPVQRFVISLLDDDESNESEDELEIIDDENSEEDDDIIENNENIDPKEASMPSPNLNSPPKKCRPVPFY